MTRCSHSIDDWCKSHLIEDSLEAFVWCILTYTVSNWWCGICRQQGCKLMVITIPEFASSDLLLNAFLQFYKWYSMSSWAQIKCTKRFKWPLHWCAVSLYCHLFCIVVSVLCPFISFESLGWLIRHSSNCSIWWHLCRHFCRMDELNDFQGIYNNANEFNQFKKHWIKF